MISSNKLSRLIIGTVTVVLIALYCGYHAAKKHSSVRHKASIDTPTMVQGDLIALPRKTGPAAVHEQKAIQHSSPIAKEPPLAKVSVNRAPAVLSPSNALSAYRFLNSTNIPPGFSLSAFHAKKNDLMNQLSGLDVPPADLNDFLIGLVQDPSQDSVTRDYALQHLTLNWYARTSKSDQQKTQRIVRESLHNTQAGIAGTSLLSMRRLSRLYNAFPESEVRQAALHLVLDEKMPDLSRMAALQVCHSLSIREALPMARVWAKQSKNFAMSLVAAAMIKDLDYENPDREEMYQTLVARMGCLNCR